MQTEKSERLAPRTSGQAFLPDSPPADVLAELAALRADVAVLQAHVAQLEAERTGHGPRDGEDLALLRAIADAAAGTQFTCSELLRHARANAPLAEALEAAGVPRAGGAIALGLLLRRLRGCEVDGVRFERTDEYSRDGIVWRFVPAEVQKSLSQSRAVLR